VFSSLASGMDAGRVIQHFFTFNENLKEGPIHFEKVIERHILENKNKNTKINLNDRFFC
jgi:hypothetical protein